MAELDKTIIEQLQSTLISTLKNAGLVLLPESAAVFANEYYDKRSNLMKRKAVSLFLVEKYKLIDGVKTRRTLINMVADGRIKPNESYKDNNTTMLLTMAIKRLNGK